MCFRLGVGLASILSGDTSAPAAGGAAKQELLARAIPVVPGAAAGQNVSQHGAEQARPDILTEAASSHHVGSVPGGVDGDGDPRGGGGDAAGAARDGLGSVLEGQPLQQQTIHAQFMHLVEKGKGEAAAYRILPSLQRAAWHPPLAWKPSIYTGVIHTHTHTHTQHMHA